MIIEQSAGNLPGATPTCRVSYAGVDAYLRSPERRARLRRRVFDTYGDVCHLCSKPGADTVDHLIARKVIRDLGLDEALLWDVELCRPAHRACNAGRGARPVPAAAAGPRVEVADGW